MTQAIDLTAKLLATENLTVVKSNVRTASFNIETRQLTLPILKDMTDDIEGMLVGHEVGHALYSTAEMLEETKENRKLHGYINVLEDVRIEKLMKRKYPGLRKTMIAGYNQLNDRDFFGVKSTNVDKLNLIDRINLWFKVGLSSGVQFTNNEKQFLIRTEKTETPDDVVLLAKEIFEFSKEQLEKEKQEKKEKQQFDNGDEDDDSDFDDDESYDDDYDDEENESDDTDEESDSQSIDNEENESDDDENGSDDSVDDSNQEFDQELESKTDKAFSKNLDELADDTFTYSYYELYKSKIERIVPYKTVLSETSEAEFDAPNFSWQEPIEPLNDRYSNFKSNTNRSVSYLVKEFEMKKAATQYKRTAVSKSGSLDMKKIWGYELNEDLFKRVTTVSQGKNHGMIFLLDWSSSMTNVMKDTIEQVIQLASFCHRVQIPFQVLAFTNCYYSAYIHGREDEEYYRQLRRDRDYLSNCHDKIYCGNFKLLELFSNKMSNQEFNTMAKRLFNTYKFNSVGRYGLYGTPLNEALAYMTDYIGTFIRKNNIEKMSFISLTDGIGGSIGPVNGRTGYKTKSFLNDPVTKKTYAFDSDPTNQTTTLLKMIKDRYSVSVVGFYVAGKMSQRDLSTACYYNGVDSYVDISNVRVEVNKNGYVSLKTKAHDKLFFVPSKSLKIKDGEIDVNGKQSSTSIARNFSKAMSGRQVNRVLLNEFISLVA